jgi:hypothetical protein
VAGENDPVPAVGNPIDQISELRSGFGHGEFEGEHVRNIQDIQNVRNHQHDARPTYIVTKTRVSATGATTQAAGAFR